MTSRKIFNYDDISENKIIKSLADRNEIYENTISACGCMFYKIVNNNLYLLLIKYADPNWSKYDDFGGVIDHSDDTLLDTIIREATEETNGVIDNLTINMYLDNDTTKTFYNKNSKYYSLLFEVDDSFHYDTDVFGIFEEADKISRTVEWYKYTDVKQNLAFRISKNPELVNHLNYLDEFNKKN
jgi:8-oxo-dGTP pyrophosphatase MutT (NUDIX family)